MTNMLKTHKLKIIQNLGNAHTHFKQRQKLEKFETKKKKKLKNYHITLVLGLDIYIKPLDYLIIFVI